MPCTQQGKASIFVNILGEVYDCPAGTTSYGSLKEISVAEAFTLIKARETNYCLGCPARDGYLAKQNL